MMTKKRTTALANMKLLIVVPVVGFVLLTTSAYREIPSPLLTTTNTTSAPSLTPSSELKKEEVAIKEESNIDKTEPFVIVEEMPQFPGGDAALLQYIYANAVYPEVAKKNNIQGKVIVRFCVTEKGGVSKLSIYKGVNPDLDAEALRVVKTLPEFQPGRQGGKPVPVWYILPITFTLK